MFSWDVRKAQTNYEKHRVAFEERCSKRLGRSMAGRVLLVVYVIRRTPHGKETIRIISARQASRKERTAYAGSQD